jgi:hypothetical protein
MATPNTASGIVRASLETRSDLILLGREEERSLSGRVFGDVVDQVRERTSDSVMVARLERPINTTARLLVVLSPSVGYHEGVPKVSISSNASQRISGFHSR